MFRDWEAPINDMLGDVNTALGWAAVRTTEAYRDTGFIMNFLRHNQSDYFQQKIQMTHQKKLGANMNDYHLHIIPMANGSGDFCVDVQYCWVDIWWEFPAISSRIDAWTITIPLVAADQYKHKLVTLLTDVTPPASESVSSIFLVKITRNPAQDTYQTNKDHWTGSANVAVLYADAHVPSERFGWPYVA